MQTMPPAPTRQDHSERIVIGCITALCILICVGLGTSCYLLWPQAWPGQRLLVATPTLLPTGTALTHQPPAGDKVFRDDFSNNDSKWRGEDNPPANVLVNDGKLTLEALRPGAFGAAYCQSCPTLASPFYIQADLSTNQSIDEAYGLAFGSTATHDDFYVFQINEQSSRFFLYKYDAQTWTLRTSRKSDLIRPYPNANTLGVDLDKDLIVMYINGQEVDTYQDTGNALGSGTFWPYTDNAGFRLTVDNFFAYGK